MPHLVKYGVMSANNSGLAGVLVKAQCDFCGAKYGSVEEARKCEAKHINCIKDNLYSCIKALEGREADR